MKKIVGLQDNKVLDTNYIVHKDSRNNKKILHDYIEDTTTYSTTEDKVVGTWVDGKPIYRKVLNYTTINPATNTDYNTDISNMDVMTKLQGVAVLEGSYPMALPSYSDATSGIYCRLRLNSAGTKIHVETSNNTFKYVYIYIEYTKTTDSPSS